MTGWKGRSVLYFGDHPYTDLADASLVHGWKTGAIIKELTVMPSLSSKDLVIRLENYYRNRNYQHLLLWFYSLR